MLLAIIRVLCCLAILLHDTDALTISRALSRDSSNHDLAPRFGGEPKPEETRPEPEGPDGRPISPVQQPGVVDPHEDPQMHATFDLADLSRLEAEYPIWIPDVEPAIEQQKTEETTIVESANTAPEIRVGTNDQRVGDVFQAFAGDVWDTGSTPDLRFTSESSTNPSKSSIRRNTVYTKQKGRTYKPMAPLPEGSVASNIPPGQAIRFAQVMTRGEIYTGRGAPPGQEAKWITVAIDKLPRVELKDNPYIETAPRLQTIQKIGEWTYKGFQPFRKLKRSTLQQRTNPLTVITTPGGGQASSKGGPNESQMANFQKYLNTFNGVQTNITNLIIPALTPLVQSTNDSMVLDMAWSIYSQLTGSSVFVAGPYMYGRHCFDSLEDQYFKSHNISSNATTFDTQTEQYLAYHHELIETYTAAWDNVTSAVNGTGLLEELFLLYKFLTPQDTSVAYDGYFTTPSMSYDDSFFKTFGITPVHNTTSSS